MRPDYNRNDQLSRDSLTPVRTLTQSGFNSAVHPDWLDLDVIRVEGEKLWRSIFTTGCNYV